MEYWVLDITLADIEMKNKHRESIKKSGKELNIYNVYLLMLKLLYNFFIRNYAYQSTKKPRK